MAKKRRPLRLITRISSEPMSPEQWRGVERILARVIARAYLADHPELLDTSRGRGDGEEAERDVK